MISFIALGSGASAEEPVIPRLWQSNERLARPGPDALPRLRFLTSTDFPPFNFANARGELAGFNVDLSRALCAALGLAARCEIQALPWDELQPALLRGEGEALIAGIAVSAQARSVLDFSRPYLPLPARFVTRKDDNLDEPLWLALRGKPLGVVAGTAHERYLHAHFPDARITAFPAPAAMLDAAAAGRVAAAFGDGMRLSQWLADGPGGACCRFAGGPYLAPDLFGQGLAIAVRAGDAPVLDAVDYGLSQVVAGEKFAELYLRWFPVGFF